MLKEYTRTRDCFCKFLLLYVFLTDVFNDLVNY
ncbi:hypothetical protein HNP25_000343 [Arcicella rosea]|uniref:Uncharacterized protein n=1 Tax=Arcicella rosea TaxID=502909 RepID=A0A841EKZ6_9BACT|nr:hypothetical protein [Arcicella rosea]